MIIFKGKAVVRHTKGVKKMDERLFNFENVKSIFKVVGIKSEECDRCMNWTSSKFDNPLTSKDMVLAELTPEEQGFLRCMGYASEEKVVDTRRLRALYETFWSTVRNLHDLSLDDLTVKEGKYIVAM